MVPLSCLGFRNLFVVYYTILFPWVAICSMAYLTLFRLFYVTSFWLHMYQILIQIENKCASVNCKQISSRKTSHTHIKFRPNKMIGGLRKCCSIVCKDLLKDVRYSLLSCAKPSYFMIIFQIAIQGKNKYKIKVSKCLSTLQNVPFELFSMYVSSFAIS